MRKQKAAGKAGGVVISALLGVCILLILSGVAEASWVQIDTHEKLLAVGASPVGDFIKQSLGQVLSLMLLAVAVIIAIPLFMAGLALSVSYVFSKASVRQEHRSPQTALHKGITAKAATIL